MTFEEFYPEYLAAHAHPNTRLVHAAGLLSGVAVGLTGIVTRKPAMILGGLALGYLPAFVTHWVWEANQPKSFEEPLLSLRGDFTMVAEMFLGTLEGTLAQNAFLVKPVGDPTFFDAGKPITTVGQAAEHEPTA
jgi:hypothetical protein